MLRQWLIAIVLLSTAGVFAAFGQTTAFTYQGRLTDSSIPPTAQYDMQFRLYDDPDLGDGTQHGTTITLPAVQVTNGIFTVKLDFETPPCATCFTGAARYLEISVKPAGSGSYANLGPRPEITSAPFANRALKASAADTATNAGALDGLDSTAFLQTTGGTMTGPLNLPLNGLNVGTNQLVAANGNVGIGTSNPATKLHVEGNSLFRTDGSNGVRITPAADNNTGILNVTNAANTVNWLTVNANGSVLMNGSGNVGIGTSTPAHKLVVSSSTDPTIRIETGGNNVVNPTLWLHDSFSTGNLAGFKIVYDNQVGETRFDNLYNDNSGDIVFRTKVAGTPVTAMTIDASGRVDMSSVTVGGGGTITGILTGTATLDFPATASGTNSDLSVTVTGASVGDVISLGVPDASMAAGAILYTAWVSAANTVTVRVIKIGVGFTDPPSGTFKIVVTRF